MSPGIADQTAIPLVKSTHAISTEQTRFFLIMQHEAA